MTIDTVAKLREFLKKAPPQNDDQKFFGSGVLAYLECQEKRVRVLTKIIFDMVNEGGEGAEQDASAASDEAPEQESLTPNVSGTGAVNPQPIPKAGAPMPPQKNGSVAADAAAKS